MTKWGRRLDAGGGIAVGFLSRDISAWIPAFAGMTHGGVAGMTIREIRGIPRHYQIRVPSFSYQSLMPAGAGTPRYEKLELRFYAVTSHRGFCHAPRPQRGTSPRTTFSHSVIDHRSTTRQDSPVGAGRRPFPIRFANRLYGVVSWAISAPAGLSAERQSRLEATARSNSTTPTEITMARTPMSSIRRNPVRNVPTMLPAVEKA